MNTSMKRWTWKEVLISGQPKFIFYHHHTYEHFFLVFDVATSVNVKYEISRHLHQTVSWEYVKYVLILKKKKLVWKGQSLWQNIVIS